MFSLPRENYLFFQAVELRIYLVLTYEKKPQGSLRVGRSGPRGQRMTETLNFPRHRARVYKNIINI